MAKLLNDHKEPSERKRKPLSIDAHVGNRLRTRRILAGMSQTELGRVVGTSFQQVQKYESGTNRISAGHLFLFAKALACTPDAFFEGLQENGDGPDRSQLLLTDETIQLFEAFGALDDRARDAVLEFARSLAVTKFEPASPGRPSRRKA